MIFCGAGNTTLQLAERAAEAVGKMLTTGEVNWGDEADDVKMQTTNGSAESITCNTNDAHGSSNLDFGNMDMSSLDIFAERIGLSTAADTTRDKFTCSWPCCNGVSQKVADADIGGLRFVPFEDGSVTIHGKENQQMNERTISRTSARARKLTSLVEKHQQRTPEDEVRSGGHAKENIYPSEIIVYRPKRKWAVDGRKPDLQISWSVDRNLEMGLINQWTGCLLKDKIEIGWITMYSISQRIARKPQLNDPAVAKFVEEFILPANNPLGAGDETSGKGAENGLRPNTKFAAARLSSEGGGIMTLSRMLAIGPIFLVTDITIQPNHRGVGLGLFLLDGACRRVAESFSLVIVSLREAVDETLKIYFGLLGFSLLDGRQDFVGRRNGRHSPCIEEICPYFPTPTGFVAGFQPG
ncbi:hypothetical protein ACA910_000467 [Epithemia clementina (nom. ined.)]